MLKILRKTLTYQYETPTRCKVIEELLFQNVGDNSVPSIYFQRTFLPELVGTDSKGNMLKIIPSQLLDKNFIEETYALSEKTKEKDLQPVGINFENPIESGEIDNIRIEYLLPLEAEEVLKRNKWTWFGYTDYKEEINPLEDTEATQYFKILIPKEYKLDVSTEPKNQISNIVVRDESTAIFRWESLNIDVPISWQIKIPKRVKLWIQFGFWFGLLIPLITLLFYFYTQNLTNCNRIILSTIAIIIGMRGLVWYSVELLDCLNYSYLALLILNIFILVFIHCYNTVYSPIPSNSTCISFNSIINNTIIELLKS